MRLIELLVLKFSNFLRGSCLVQVGEIISRFEKKGFYLKGNFNHNKVYNVLFLSLHVKSRLV